MLFPSIFHVNGEAVVARVDENRETSSFNGHLRSRLGLTDGDSVVVSVPIGEINHSCRAVVIAGEHAEDLVLGSTWLRRFYMDALQIMRSPGGMLFFVYNFDSLSDGYRITSGLWGWIAIHKRPFCPMRRRSWIEQCGYNGLSGHRTD